MIYVNSNTSIQFAMECSKDAISFLDILIKRNDDKIWMDIYYKPTNTLRCLAFSSNDPKRCKTNISFTLAYHICTIVENTEAKMKQEILNELKQISVPKTIN